MDTLKIAQKKIDERLPTFNALRDKFASHFSCKNGCNKSSLHIAFGKLLNGQFEKKLNTTSLNSLRNLAPIPAQAIIKATLLIGILLIAIFILGTFSLNAAPTDKEFADAVTATKLNAFGLNNVFLLFSAALVFIMHLGFATLESGLTQRKNTVNILFKNSFIISMGLLTYYYYGFVSHYPENWLIDKFLAIGKVAAPDADGQTMAYGDYTFWTDFIFQAMFAATAGTIVSGAVAERIKISGFMIFATLLVGIAYPWAGSWHWGKGFLNELGFYDFAGSTVVHAFGGFAALACVILLGARRGKYTKNGIKPILGHSMPLASVGVFLLWFGWFGFNGGSVLKADPDALSVVYVTTSLASAGGCIGAIFTSWIVLKKPDLSMALNGMLAGLVGITAGADAIDPKFSTLVGFIAGIIVVFSILAFDRIKIDDPVGAISVHGICGIWGTLAVALFSDKAKLGVQLLGALSVCAFAFIFSIVVFGLIKVVMGVRVSPELEYEGLDVDEHGSPAYIME